MFPSMGLFFFKLLCRINGCVSDGADRLVKFSTIKSSYKFWPLNRPHANTTLLPPNIVEHSTPVKCKLTHFSCRTLGANPIFRVYFAFFRHSLNRGITSQQRRCLTPTLFILLEATIPAVVMVRKAGVLQNGRKSHAAGPNLIEKQNRTASD